MASPVTSPLDLIPAPEPMLPADTDKDIWKLAQLSVSPSKVANEHELQSSRSSSNPMIPSMDLCPELPKSSAHPGEMNRAEPLCSKEMNCESETTNTTAKKRRLTLSEYRARRREQPKSTADVHEELEDSAKQFRKEVHPQSAATDSTRKRRLTLSEYRARKSSPQTALEAQRPSNETNEHNLQSSSRSQSPCPVMPSIDLLATDKPLSSVGLEEIIAGLELKYPTQSKEVSSQPTASTPRKDMKSDSCLSHSCNKKTQHSSYQSSCNKSQSPRKVRRGKAYRRRVSTKPIFIKDDTPEKYIEITSTTDTFQRKHEKFTYKGRTQHMRQLAMLKCSLEMYSKQTPEQ